jgi:hypothetical protein
VAISMGRASTPISDKMSQNFCGYDFNTIVSGSESCIFEDEIYPQIKINQKNLPKLIQLNNPKRCILSINAKISR